MITTITSVSRPTGAPSHMAHDMAYGLGGVGRMWAPPRPTPTPSFIDTTVTVVFLFSHTAKAVGL